MVTKNLITLQLASTRISDATVAGLPALPALTHLGMDNVATIGDAAATAIVKHRNLTSLSVGRTVIGDLGVQILCDKLPDLNHLGLNGTNVTDAGAPALKRLKTIERLELNDTSITDASVEHLKWACNAASGRPVASQQIA